MFNKVNFSFVLSAALTLTAWAAPDLKDAPQKFDADGHSRQKIVHRLAPEIYMQSPFGSHGKATIIRAPSAGSTSVVSRPISYHGGPIMPTVSSVVLIWYGNWNQTNGSDNANGQQIIRDAIWGLAQNNSTYNYSGITTGYSSTLGSFTGQGTTSVSMASSPNIVEYTQTYSPSYGNKTLKDSSVWSLVKRFAGAGDPNAIYLVLSSSDVSESSGFLTQYCGWHDYNYINSVSIKYGFIGNPLRSLSACAAQTVSPNGNAGVDAMVSTIAHELAETVTDPEISAWYNSVGSENSDLCAWTFGSNMQKLPSGAYWNVNLPTVNNAGTRNYLLQRQLSASNSKCYINATGAVQ
jgi:hypothetical protein